MNEMIYDHKTYFQQLGYEPAIGRSSFPQFSPFLHQNYLRKVQEKGKMLKKHLLTSECSTQHLFANGNIQHVFFIPENSPVENRHPLNYGKYCYNLFILPHHIYTTNWNRRLVEILVSPKLY